MGFTKNIGLYFKSNGKSLGSSGGVKFSCDLEQTRKEPRLHMGRPGRKLRHC